MDEISWKLEQKQIQLIMSGWIHYFRFGLGFFFSCSFAYRAPDQRLIIAHDAITSWNPSMTHNFQMKGVISQNKKQRYLSRLENEKWRSKSTNSKWPEMQPKARLMLFAGFSFHALWNWGSAIKGKLGNWFQTVSFAREEHCLCQALLCCAASPLLLPPQQISAKAAPGLCCEQSDERRLPSVICAAPGEGSSGCTHRGAHHSLCLELKEKKKKKIHSESAGMFLPQPVHFPWVFFKRVCIPNSCCPSSYKIYIFLYIL